MSVTQLVDLYHQRQAEAGQEMRRKRQMLQDRLREAIMDGLPVWFRGYTDEIEATGEERFWFNDDGRHSRIDASLEIDFEWDERVFCIVATACREGRSYGTAVGAKMQFTLPAREVETRTINRREGAVELPVGLRTDDDGWMLPQAADVMPDETLGAFWAAFEEAVEQQVQEVRKAAAEKRGWEIARLRNDILYAGSIEELQERYEQAVQRYPDERERFEEVRAQREPYVREQDAKRREHERHRSACVRWVRDWWETVQRNREKLAALQTELKRPIRCGVLEYGIVALDDDGARFVETRRLHTAGESTEGEWWPVVTEKHVVQQQRVFHPVRYGEVAYPFDEAPEELVQSLRVEDAAMEVRFPYDVSAEGVSERVAALGLESLPEPEENFSDVLYDVVREFHNSWEVMEALEFARGGPIYPF